MAKKMSLAIVTLLFCAATAVAYEYTAHNHSSTNGPIIGHGGGLDSSGGHNCSEKSQRKGLCSGYHYHR